MKVKLTKTVVDAAGAATTEYELRDTLVPGFMLRVTPTGRKTFTYDPARANLLLKESGYDWFPGAHAAPSSRALSSAAFNEGMWIVSSRNSK